MPIKTFPGLVYELEMSGTLKDFQVVPGSLFTANDFTASFDVQMPEGTKNFLRGVRK